MSEKTLEQTAEEWVEANMSWDRYECDWDGAGKETFLAGDAHGYERGKQEERERIWRDLQSGWTNVVEHTREIKTTENGQTTIEYKRALNADRLKEIIFGGSDEKAK